MGSYATHIQRLWRGTQQSVYNAVAPVVWTDLDLSAYIGGARRALVLLEVINTGATRTFYFRPNGDASDVGAGASDPGGNSLIRMNLNQASWILCETDAAGIIEWYCAAANTAIIVFWGCISEY